LGDRPTASHRKKLSVRKPKLWPQNGQTEWNRPKQWKRINEMRIENWNLSTLYRAGAMNELIKGMDKYKIDIYEYVLCEKLDCQGKEL